MPTWLCNWRMDSRAISGRCGWRPALLQCRWRRQTTMQVHAQTAPLWRFSLALTHGPARVDKLHEAVEQSSRRSIPTAASESRFSAGQQAPATGTETALFCGEALIYEQSSPLVSRDRTG